MPRPLARVGRAMALGAACLAGWTPVAQAGMTSYTLNDVVRLRLEDISFFAVLLLVSGFGLRLIWNHVASGLPGLPRLTVGRALGLTAVLSLVLLLVLSMISGARELLTPGAWRRQGTGYRLNENVSEPVRRESLLHLKAALEHYATQHSGRFPPHDYVPEIHEKLWIVPGNSAMRYLYFAPMGTNARTQLVVIEPEILGSPRFALRADGELLQLSSAEVRAALTDAAKGAKP